MQPDIVIERDPGVAERLAILRPLAAFNSEVAPPPNFESVAVLVRDGVDGECVGGLWGVAGWGWMQIELLFVPEALRAHGIGSRLLQEAEATARHIGCNNIWVDTYSFQALNFYRKNQYVLFGELENYPDDFKRHFLKKNLK